MEAQQAALALEKTLMLGKIEGERRRGQQRIRLLDGITYSMDMSLSMKQSWPEQLDTSAVLPCACPNPG